MTALSPMAEGILYGVGIVAAILIVFALGYREWDRKMDRCLMLNKRTNEPAARRVRIDDGEFTFRAPDGRNLLVSLPHSYRPFHARGHGSTVIIDEKGHVLHVDTIDKDGSDTLETLLRPFDAEHYFWASSSVVWRQSVRSYDPKKTKVNAKGLLIGAVVVLALIAMGTWAFQSGWF